MINLEGNDLNSTSVPLSLVLEPPSVALVNSKSDKAVVAREEQLYKMIHLHILAADAFLVPDTVWRTLSQ